MPQQHLSPDKELLDLGWERDAATDRYRLGTIGWLSRNEARALANTAWPPDDTPLAVEPDDPSIRVLLQRILETLQHIDETLGQIPTRDAIPKSGFMLCSGATAYAQFLSNSGTAVFSRPEDMPQSTLTNSENP